MPIFYERKEDQDKVTIAFKYRIHFILLVCVVTPLAINLIFPNLSQQAWDIITAILLALIFYYLVETFKPNSEVAKAMKAEKILVYGSASSLTNHLTYEIPKKNQKN